MELLFKCLAIKLANAPAEMWKQLFFDAATRRQTPFQAVVIGLMNNRRLDPVVVSSCIFLEDESAETSVKNTIERVRFVLSMMLFIIIVSNLKLFTHQISDCIT